MRAVRRRKKSDEDRITLKGLACLHCDSEKWLLISDGSVICANEDCNSRPRLSWGIADEHAVTH